LNYISFFIAILAGVFFLITPADAADNAPKRPSPTAHQLLDAMRKVKTVNFCGEPVPLEEAEVRERFEREFILSLDNESQIILWLKRANRYFPHIEQELKRNGLPDDLKFLTIAESALKPHASSHKGAVGYWQFIEGTGIRYGMKVNPDADERRNFYASTGAAIAYLKDLYNIFGSWTLAAAAYNMGEEGLRAEILVQKVNNYYQLYLSQETQRYVFRILAAKIILSNPEQFGISIPREDLYQPVSFDRVEVTAKQLVPIYIIAQAANTYFKVIKDLNPQIRNYYIPEGIHQIFVPKGAAASFPERYEKLLAQWLAEKKERIYTVKKGENLSVIAARHNVPVKALMIWNGISNGKKIAPGDKLVIFSPDLKTENNGRNSDEKDKAASSTSP